MVEYQPAKIDLVTPPLGCFGVFFLLCFITSPRRTPLHRFLFPLGPVFRVAVTLTF